MEQGPYKFFKYLQDGAIGALKVIHPLTGGRYRYQSVLNGLVGDTLEAEKHPLSIDMDILGKAKGKKVCLFVHGLFDNEHAWDFPRKPAQDYGTMLKKDLGFTPLYVRYNTGLHISTNGRRLARRLTQWFKTHPPLPQEIVLVGHSMGGLVIRSACHYGRKQKAPWVNRVKKIFFLGTPHLGTDWEKIGQLTRIILQWIPNPITMGIAAIGDRRSAGIKDLRFGHLLDEDWKGKQGDALWHHNRPAVPLLKHVDYYLMTAILAKDSKNVFWEYFGDGLVPLRSALGKSFIKHKALPFLPEHIKNFKGLKHTDLSHHLKVYRQIQKWIQH